MDTISVTRNSSTYTYTTSRVSSAKSTSNTQKALAQLGQCSNTYKSSVEGSKSSVDTNKVLERNLHSGKLYLTPRRIGGMAEAIISVPENF